MGARGVIDLLEKIVAGLCIAAVLGTALYVGTGHLW